MSEHEYLARFLRHFAKLVPGIDLVNAIDCADAFIADKSDNPEGDAESEASEWKNAS